LCFALDYGMPGKETAIIRNRMISPNPDIAEEEKG
jgi:hypothetical protein